MCPSCSSGCNGHMTALPPTTPSSSSSESADSASLFDEASGSRDMRLPQCAETWVVHGECPRVPPTRRTRYLTTMSAACRGATASALAVTRTSPRVRGSLISWMAPRSRNARSSPTKTRWRMGRGCVVPRAHVDVQPLVERGPVQVPPPDHDVQLVVYEHRFGGMVCGNKRFTGHATASPCGALYRLIGKPGPLSPARASPARCCGRAIIDHVSELLFGVQWAHDSPPPDDAVQLVV